MATGGAGGGTSHADGDARDAHVGDTSTLSWAEGTLPDGWMLERNGPPSSSSLRCPASGLSLSLDGDLPEGWAIGRGADACRFFMNVFTGERRDARPAAEGAAPAGSPARTGGGVAAAKRGRERDGGAAPPPSLRAAEPTEPSPFVGWLRDKQIMKIRKVMAAAVKKHGPLNKRTKTARAVHRSGYLQGLQGMFARFIFRHAGEETADDPVIPAEPPADPSMLEELRDAGLSESAAGDVYASVQRACSAAVKKLQAATARAAAQPPASIKRTVLKSGDIELRWNGPRSVAVKLHPAHYEKLRRLYTRATPEDADCLAMDRRIFCMVQRMETLSAGSSGYQGANPDHVFEAMRETFGVDHECFASPLNCYYSSFCSLFPDTDRFFGSRGNFFSFQPTHGSFESNPPFVNEVMTKNVMHIEALLGATEEPMSVIIVVPAWDDDECDSYRRTLRSRFLRHQVRLRKDEHQYKDGMQHRASRIVWDANVDSFYFWLQNEAGAKKWPVTTDSVNRLLDACRSRAC